MKEEDNVDKTSWIDHIKQFLGKQIYPCVDYFKTHKIATLILMILVGLIVYELFIIPLQISRNIGKIMNLKGGTINTAAAEAAMSAVSSDKTLKSKLSGQLSSGLINPVSNQIDKLAPYYYNTGETFRSFLYTLLEIVVIMLVFFPCMSLVIIIVASWFMIKPKIKFLKSL
jgi:hypothetical protein